MTNSGPFVELTLRDGATLDHLLAFVNAAHRLGFPLSSRVQARFNDVTLLAYLHTLTPATERRRDPDTGRFMRVVS